jgi:RND superfamily putative drug exporter
MSWAVRRPVVALVAWLVLVVALGVAASALGGKPDDSFALPGVQSTTAQNLLEKLGAVGTSDPNGKVVWSPRTGTVTEPANEAAAVDLLKKIAAEPFVLCVTGPFQANYGRSCPKPQPSDLAAALNAEVTAQLAKALHIPPDKVAPVVALLESLAPLSDADPAKLAAIARALPEIARLASAPQSTLDALAALTPAQLQALVGLTTQDVADISAAFGGLAKLAELPPATLAKLAAADPAKLAAIAAALPKDVAGLEAFWADLAKFAAKYPGIAADLEKLLHITAAELQQWADLMEAIAPIAKADPQQLAALARALPELARIAKADPSALEALGKLTPQDLSFLVGLTEADVVDITKAFGGLAQLGHLPADVKKQLADADPATLAAFAEALPKNIAVLEADIAQAKAALATLDAAATATQAATSPVSKDGTVAYATVTFDGAKIPSSLLGNRVGDVLDLVSAANGDVLTVGASGATFDNGPAQPDTSIGIGLIAALVVLLIAFGSLVAAGLPLVVAITGLVGGLMALAVAERFLSIASFTPSLAVMIGLGVGIDYALFIMSRFTQEARAGAEPKDAALRAVRTAGRAVAFAGCTVIIALLGMFVLRINFFNGLAVGAAVTVLMVMLSALWMLPALLSLLGHRALAWRMPWARHPKAVDPAASKWAAYGALLQKAPIVPVLLVLAVVLGLASPALKMQQGFPDDGSAVTGSPVRIGYDLLAKGFGPGVNGPFFVAVQTSGKDADAATVASVVKALEATPGVASTLPSTAMMPLVSLNKKLFVDGVTSVIVYPTTAPADPETAALLDRIRGTTTAEVEKATGARLYVGGSQAVATDFTTVLSGALPLFLLIVIGFGFVALLVLFHSLVIPLTAAITSLLSFGASLGVTVAVFQLGVADKVLGVSGTGPILPFLPIMVFAILFGLSMDYQVFLVTRMKETWDRTHDNRDAVRLGLAGSGKVVVAAARSCRASSSRSSPRATRPSRCSASRSPRRCSSTRSWCGSSSCRRS